MFSTLKAEPDSAGPKRTRSLSARQGSQSVLHGLARAILLGYLTWTVGPMLWLLTSSFKPSSAVFNEPFALPGPSQATLQNYHRAWQVGEFATSFGNSVWVTTVTVLLTLILSSMSAYALARFRFRGNRALLFFFLAGLMIPIQLAVVPLFFELKHLHLLNSLSGLILVYLATSLPFAIFVLTGFFRQLPGSLREAALIDGCSEFEVFWKVFLPLAQPGLITVAIFTFLGVWNEYLVALTLLSGEHSQALRTLPLGLANLTITSQYRTDYGMTFAGIVIVMLPTLLVYVALEKHLTRGIAAGALKG